MSCHPGDDWILGGGKDTQDIPHFLMFLDGKKTSYTCQLGLLVSNAGMTQKFVVKLSV